MIIKNSNLMGKKFRYLFLIISLSIDFLIFATLVSIFIITYKSENYENNTNFILLIILSLLSTFSILDIIEILRKKRSIAFFISQRILKDSNLDNTVFSELNTTQKVFCEKIYGTKEKNGCLYVYGKQNKGKSTAVLYFLKGLSKNCEKLSDMPWINNFTFIDCTSNKKEIVEYFLMNQSVNTRISRFSNSLTVIDNIEYLGKTFFEENIGLFTSYKSFFIVIEDTTTDLPINKLDTNDAQLLIYDFNSSVIGIKSTIHLGDQLISLKPIERKVFFALYFLTISSQFADINEIKEIIEINNISLHITLNKITKLTKSYVPFPFNTKYYYCCNRSCINKIENILLKFPEYKSVLDCFLKSSATNSECRWICLIRSTEETILRFSYEDKITLFKKALYNGKYQELYNELSASIAREPIKENLFLYEKGFLSLYIGNHRDSTNIFLKLIKTLDSESKRKEMMLHIIESSHGNPQTDNMNLIYSFINEMQSKYDFYSICAFYWKKHIDTEKGVFEIVAFENIRNKIKYFPDSYNNSLYRSIKHRSFLDEIRCYHILGEYPSDKFLSEYSEFLKTCNSSRNEYYSNLYIEANTIHYVKIIDAILSDDYSSENLLTYTNDAEHFYKKALSSSYSDQKSRKATKIKLLDLRMIYSDFDYENTIKQVNLFNIQSQINNVQVHEAFCETILIKAKILNPNNISNDSGFNISIELFLEIKQHFEKGYRIYQEYGNRYGMMRLKFLIILLELMKSDFSSLDNIKNLKLLKNEYIKYPKEKRIIENLLNKCENNICSNMFLLSIIRAYPIILQ